MKQASNAGNRGFTLMEMLISLAVGMIVLSAAVQLFNQGMDAIWVESQKAEMHQDLRAAANLMVKDITLAGEGMQNAESGIALANGGGAVVSVRGCNQSGACPPNGAINYPTPPGAAVPPTLYPIMPGYQLGITPPGSTTPSDVITVVYEDPVLALGCYQVSFPNAPTVNPVTFTLPGNYPASCLPAGVVAPQPLVGSVQALQAGDVLLFSQGSSYAVAEVTATAGANGIYNITFANNDPLRLNQSTAASNDLTAIATSYNTCIKNGGSVASCAATINAMRLEVITYYLLNEPDPTGLTTGTPTLMRQVNGQTAVPVAENVVNLQFTYDTYNSDGTLLSGAGDGGYSVGDSYNLIRKVNVLHLSIRSTLQGVRTALMATKGYQGFDYQTSISARNLSYQQQY
jgi:prepilin-type N-terminal cleavage/methylation domain-containing protein